MKVFNTSSINIIDECYEMFNVKQLISERKFIFSETSIWVVNFVVLWRLMQLKTSYHKMVKMLTCRKTPINQSILILFILTI